MAGYVDATEKIQAFVAQIDEMVQEGLITMEQVQVIKYRATPPPPATGMPTN